MKLFNSTKKWVKWWTKRKIDWGSHYMNPKHPHRLLIAETLRHIPWMSLFEVGCGAGANLVTIVNMNPGKQVGGIDINPDAISFAKTQFRNGLFKVSSADNIMMSDKSMGIILSDMVLIYITPRHIGRYLKEFKRVAGDYVILCELHSTSWWKRFALKWREGYNAYDWPKLLEKHEFYDIKMYKLKKEDWPESNLQQKYGYIIVAKVPNY